MQQLTQSDFRGFAQSHLRLTNDFEIRSTSLPVIGAFRTHWEFFPVCFAENVFSARVFGIIRALNFLWHHATKR